jgi:histidinol phosphatase-like PHP family hydrolase
VDGAVTASLHNGEIGELLIRAAAEQEGHRRLALERAAKEAWRWPEEAGDVAKAGRSLTELTSVGPWVAHQIHDWLETPPEVPEPDDTRRNFLTYAQVRSALATDPAWETEPHADLQIHTTDSDGKVPLPEMVAAARASGLAYHSITDHTQTLKIANGQTPERLRDQGRRIDELNETLQADGSAFRVLRSVEMDVFDHGEGDMDPAVLDELDIVLGAFHSKLRSTDDATERYIAALRNPHVHVLAHPTTRMFGRRAGLVADWPRVFAEAAALGKALEIDATPRRQDLPVELARIALAEGVEWFSMGSDAHYIEELPNLPFGMGIAQLAGIPRERFLMYRPAEDVIAWAAALSNGDRA